MAIGFGFSCSDLFAGLKVIKDSVEAVCSERKGASADYTALLTEITSLQDALETVAELQDLQTLPPEQCIALERAVQACRETVEKFLESISKYRPHLHAQASSLRSNYYKIRWSLLKKDDVADFRSQLGRHASSITMLLTSFQAKQTLSVSGNGDVLKSRKAESDCVHSMLSGLSIEQRQFFIIMMKQNAQLMQSMDDLKSMMQTQAAIPPQILLQQPVILVDPFGRTAPFHLEFIDSPECFIAVLKARFTNAGVEPAGLSKLDNHEFLIRDTQRKRPVDITKKWASVFRPGQKVEMSMVFHRFACPPSTCPGCLETNEDDGDEQICCQACGLCYQSLRATSKTSPGWGVGVSGDVCIAGDEIPYILHQSGQEPEMKVFRPIDEAEDKVFHGFRRVQIVSQTLDLLASRYAALQLVEDFSRFAKHLVSLPDDMSPYMPEIHRLHIQAIYHQQRQQNRLPAFASFSQIEQVRMECLQESVELRQEIDRLVQNLCKDEDTKHLLRHIEAKYRQGHGRDYYTGVLTQMTALSEFTRSTNSKVRSPEKMQWLMLDSRSK